MADNNVVTDKLIIQYESAGAAAFANDANRAKTALEGITVVSERVEKSTGSVDSKFAALERRFSTVAGQAAQLEKVQKDVNAAVAANPALQERANAVMDAAAKRFTAANAVMDATAKGFTAVENKGKLARYEWINLSRQLQDVGVSLASGQNPLTVLVQQGSQIADIAQTSGVGLSGLFRNVAGAAAALITPLNVAIASTAALGVAAATAALQYDKLQTSSQRAIQGAGARTGTSIEDINRFTNQNSSSIGLGISSKDARALAEDFTRTGEVVISRLHGMSDAVLGFANQTGKSIDDVRKDFVGFALEPKKGLEELSKVYGAFDETTRRTVEGLAAAGDKTGAFQAMIDALAEKSRKAAETMNVFEKAGRGIVNFLNISQSPSGLATEIEKVKAALDAAIEGASRLGPDDARIGAASESVARLSRELEKLQAAQEKDNTQALTDQLNNFSQKAEQATNSIFPQIGAIKQLDEAIRNLSKMPDIGPSRNDQALVVAQQLKGAQQESLQVTIRHAAAVQQLQQAYGGVSQQTAIILQNLQGQLLVAQQVTQAGQMRAQYEAQYAQLTLQGVAAEEAAQIAAAQYAVSQAQATSSVMQQVQALRDQNAMIKAAQNGTEATTAAGIAYRNAIRSGADSTAAAALRAETLKNMMLQSADAARQFATAMNQAQNSFTIAGYPTFQDGAPYGTNVASEPTTGFQSTWETHPTGGTAYATTDLATALRIYNAKNGAAPTAPPSLQQRVNNSIASGGSIQSAINLAQAATPGTQTYQNSYGVPGSPGYVQGQSSSTTTTQGEILSTVQQLYQAMNAGTKDKAQQAANLQQELAWLQSQPQSLETITAINQLTQQIEQLTNSTDSLNNTNQELLSPYYNEDPRTSHIGYRSQGMSAVDYNDLPSLLHSGGGSGSGGSGSYTFSDPPVPAVMNPPATTSAPVKTTQNVTINVPITIVGNPNVDQFGRTAYQAARTAMQQLNAAQR